jgi:hypothetical protein
VKSRIERQSEKADARLALKNAGHRPVASNRRAFHEYNIEEKLEAGVSLTGPEVKSLREGKASLQDGYVAVAGGEAWLGTSTFRRTGRPATTTSTRNGTASSCFTNARSSVSR